MTFRIVFNPKTLPRTMTRDEWRKLWHRKREAERLNRNAIELRKDQIALLQGDYPEFTEVLKKDLENLLTYPPLLVRE